MRRVLGNVEDAVDFLVEVAIGLLSDVGETPEPPVPEASVEPVLVEFDSWSKTWGAFDGVAVANVELAVDNAKSETV